MTATVPLTTPDDSNTDRSDLLGALALMWRIRRFEELAVRGLEEGLVLVTRPRRWAAAASGSSGPARWLTHWPNRAGQRCSMSSSRAIRARCCLLPAAYSHAVQIKKGDRIA